MATRKRKKTEGEQVEVPSEGASGLSTTSGKGNLQKRSRRVFSMGSALIKLDPPFFAILCLRVVCGVPVYLSLCSQTPPGNGRCRGYSRAAWQGPEGPVGLDAGSPSGGPLLVGRPETFARDPVKSGGRVCGPAGDAEK